MKIKPGIRVIGVAFEENDPELIYIRKGRDGFFGYALVKEGNKITTYKRTKKGEDKYYYIYGTNKIFVISKDKVTEYNAKKYSYYLKGAAATTRTVTKKFLLFFSSTIEENIPLKYYIFSEKPIPDIYIWTIEQFRANLLKNVEEVHMYINNPNVPLYVIAWQKGLKYKDIFSAMWLYLTHDYHKDIVWLLELMAENGMWSRQIVTFANQVRPGHIRTGLGYSEILPPLFIFMALQNAVERSLLTWNSFKSSPSGENDLKEQLKLLQSIIGGNNENPSSSSSEDLETLLKAVQSAINKDEHIKQLMSMMAEYLGLSKIE